MPTTRSKYGFSNPDGAGDYFFKSGRGISHDVVEAIAEHKNEPGWMRKVRHQATTSSRDRFHLGRRPLRHRLRQHLLLHQADREAGGILGSGRHQGHLGQARDPRGREEVPRGRRRAIRVRGCLPQAARATERAGSALPRQDSGLREHAEIVKQYFGTIIPSNDNKFAALNTAVWSGGSFIYVPPGVQIELPLQAYFRINAENMANSSAR